RSLGSRQSWTVGTTLLDCSSRRFIHHRAPTLTRIMRYIVIGALVLIVASLGSALYFLYRDRGHGTRMVKALAIRVALSACLLIFLVVSYRMGWIGETGLR